MTRSSNWRSSSILVALCTLLLSACATTSEKSPVEPISEATRLKFNKIADEAAADKKRRSSSGSSKRLTVAFDAVVKFDRDNTHRFYRTMSKLGFEKDQGYIDSAELVENVSRMFMEAGVMMNSRYSGPDDDFLIPLGQDYQLSDEAQQIFAELYSSREISTPTVQTVDTQDESLGHNFAVGRELAVVDTGALARSAKHYGISAESLIDSVALHEAVHIAHSVLFRNRKSSVYRKNLDEINKNSPIIYYHWREVEEFLADAAAVQLGRESLVFISSRTVRSTEAVDDPSARSYRRTVPHDASAAFLHAMLVDEESTRDELPAGKIDALRQLRITLTGSWRIPDKWLESYWVDYTGQMFTEAFVTKVQKAYRDEFERITRIVFSKIDS